MVAAGNDLGCILQFHISDWVHDCMPTGSFWCYARFRGSRAQVVWHPILGGFGPLFTKIVEVPFLERPVQVGILSLFVRFGEGDQKDCKTTTPQRVSHQMFMPRKLHGLVLVLLRAQGVGARGKTSWQKKCGCTRSWRQRSWAHEVVACGGGLNQSIPVGSLALVSRQGLMAGTELRLSRCDGSALLGCEGPPSSNCGRGALR